MTPHQPLTAGELAAAAGKLKMAQAAAAVAASMNPLHHNELKMRNEAVAQLATVDELIKNKKAVSLDTQKEEEEKNALSIRIIDLDAIINPPPP